MPPVNRGLLKDRRDEKDLSNRQLAGLVKISPAYLDNVLCGADDPSNRLIHRFARVLDLPFADLVEGAEADRTPQGDPSEPPNQPPNQPTHPPRRQDAEKQTGPRRVGDLAVS